MDRQLRLAVCGLLILSVLAVGCDKQGEGPNDPVKTGKELDKGRPEPAKPTDAKGGK